ncbi:MAG: ATP-dependent DNA ligase, partial [Acidobacteriota bacterium]|nr:ATP-dependent DNA ligase [Acidobacteriota bacterium]
MDETNKTNAKVAAMKDYFSSAPPADCAWTAFFLCGGKLRAPIPMRSFRAWACEMAEIPEWLFEECYDAVGDLAETAALLYPNPKAAVEDDQPLASWVENRLARLRELPEPEQKVMILDSWNRLNARQRFVWNKLITGAFRVGVSKALVIRAISLSSNIAEDVIAHRMMGGWKPTATAWEEMQAVDNTETNASRPYPFCLAYPLQAPSESLGPVSDWLAEWKWDGI